MISLSNLPIVPERALTCWNEFRRAFIRHSFISVPIFRLEYRKLLNSMVQNNRESRLQYWAICSSVCTFANTAHSFACSTLLASQARSAVLTRLLARSLCSLPRSWGSEWLDGHFSCVFFLFWTIVGSNWSANRVCDQCACVLQFLLSRTCVWNFATCLRTCTDVICASERWLRGLGACTTCVRVWASVRVRLSVGASACPHARNDRRPKESSKSELYLLLGL